MAGAEVARPFVNAAASTHPSLIDQTHYMDARFGVTNIPQVMWLDESSTIVRPPHPAGPLPVGEAALGIVEMIGGLDERRTTSRPSPTGSRTDRTARTPSSPTR